MIVNRAHAEEASKELMIHGFFLQGLTEQHVQEAYRSRARETHPDAGGTSEEFAAVDRAKHILLKWLARTPDAQPAALATGCAKCGGKGYIKVQRGFRSMSATCPMCRGTGDTNFEHDKTDV